MVLAFLVLPPLTARLLSHRLSHIIVLASGIGGVASITGVALSRHILTFHGVGLSTGGIVVSILGCFYLLGALIKWLIDFSNRSRYSSAHEKSCSPG
jgi:manganese/zinc/iron transport system permease protein